MAAQQAVLRQMGVLRLANIPWYKTIKAKLKKQCGKRCTCAAAIKETL